MKKVPATIIAAAGMTTGLLGFALPAGAATHGPDLTRSAHSRTGGHPGYIRCFTVSHHERGYIEDSQYNRYEYGRDGRFTEYGRDGRYLGEGTYREDRRGSYDEFYVVTCDEGSWGHSYGGHFSSGGDHGRRDYRHEHRSGHCDC